MAHTRHNTQHSTAQHNICKHSPFLIRLFNSISIRTARTHTHAHIPPSTFSIFIITFCHLNGSGVSGSTRATLFICKQTNERWEIQIINTVRPRRETTATALCSLLAPFAFGQSVLVFSALVRRRTSADGGKKKKEKKIGNNGIVILIEKLKTDCEAQQKFGRSPAASSLCVMYAFYERVTP